MPSCLHPHPGGTALDTNLATALPKQFLGWIQDLTQHRGHPSSKVDAYIPLKGESATVWIQPYHTRQPQGQGKGKEEFYKTKLKVMMFQNGNKNVLSQQC